MSPERWIDTTAASFAHVAYASANVCGAGGRLDTGVKVLSASALRSSTRPADDNLEWYSLRSHAPEPAVELGDDVHAG